MCPLNLLREPHKIINTTIHFFFKHARYYKTMKLSYAICAASLTALMLYSAPVMAEEPSGEPTKASKKIRMPGDKNHPPFGKMRGPNGRGKRAVTPYGDFCPRCSNYGMRKESVGMKEAIKAIKHYFTEKGLTIKNIKGGRRFIKVDVYQGDKLVDRILFDKRTGRIRSIY